MPPPPPPPPPSVHGVLYSDLKNCNIDVSRILCQNYIKEFMQVNDSNKLTISDKSLLILSASIDELRTAWKGTLDGGAPNGS